MVQTDKARTKISGNWNTTKRGSYGPTLLSSDTTSKEIQSVRFIPEITKGGKYKAYMYLPKLAGLSSVIPLKISDGKSEKDIQIKTADIQVIGQTSGEWVLLGTYDLLKGEKAFVEISNKNADGLVFADAVMMVPDFK